MKKTTKTTFLLFLIFLLNSHLSSSQWITNGPFGGVVRCMSKNNEATFTVTGNLMEAKKIYKSVDNGLTWINITGPTTPDDIRAIICLDNFVFIGTGSGVYRSSDNGLNWVLKSNGFPTSNWVNHLAINGTTIFAGGTSNNLMKSVDFGETWTIATNGLNNNYLYSLAAKDGIVYAGTGDQLDGVFRSSDNGNSWQNVSSTMAYYFNGTFVSGYAPMITSIGFKNSEIFVGTSEFQGIWKSSDNGDNWTHIGLESLNYQEITAIESDGINVFAGTIVDGVLKYDGTTLTPNNNGIDIHRSVSTLKYYDNKMFAGTASGVYKSTTNTSTWAASNNGIVSQNTTFPAFAKKGTQIFVGTSSGGIFSSIDEGLTWQNISEGLPFNQWMLSSIYSNADAIFAWDRYSTNGGDSWGMSNDITNGTINANGGARWLNQDGTWYNFNNSGVNRSTDIGTTWSQINNGLDSNAFFHSLNSNGNTLFLAASTGIYHSDDNGNSWSVSTLPVFNSHALNNAKFIDTEYTVLYGLSGGGGLRGIFLSQDNGATWSQVSNMLVHKFVKSNSTIYASGTNLETINGQPTEVPRIMSSLDNGLTWAIISTNNYIITNSIFAEGTNIYVALSAQPDFGVLRSSDNGNNWVNISDGLPKTYISSFEIVNNTIFAATSDSSVWQRSLEEFLAPTQPLAINGLTSPCAGSTQVYQVDSSSASNVIYNWQVPTNWTILSGQNSNSITVLVGNTSGVVLVTPSNPFGAAPSQSSFITPVNNAPSQPNTIVGNVTPCVSSTQVYSVNNVAGVVYSWSFPSDWNLISGAGTNTIIVEVGATNGTIEVTPSNECGIGTSQSFTSAISNLPVLTGTINGSQSPATGTTQFYNVVNTPGVVYTWSIPSDWVLVNGQGTNFIGVIVGTDSGEITCIPSNSCGEGQPLTMNLTTLDTNYNDFVGVKVYPNPANESIQINFGNSDFDNITITLYDVLGKTVSEFSNINNNQYTITRNGWANGLYFLRIKNQNSSKILKVVFE